MNSILNQELRRYRKILWSYAVWTLPLSSLFAYCYYLYVAYTVKGVPFGIYILLCMCFIYVYIKVHLHRKSQEKKRLRRVRLQNATLLLETLEPELKKLDFYEDEIERYKIVYCKAVLLFPDKEPSELHHFILRCAVIERMIRPARKEVESINAPSPPIPRPRIPGVISLDFYKKLMEEAEKEDNKKRA